MVAPICTPEKIERFAAELSETGQVKKACAAAGISRRTAFYWRKLDATFAAAWDEALKVAVTVLEDEALRRAQEGNERPVFNAKGEQTGVVREYSDTLAIFLLKAANPAKYRERLSLTGEDGGPLQTEIVIRKMFVPADPAESGDDGAAQA